MSAAMIYEIMLMEKKQAKTDKHGFPDMGTTDFPGYFLDYEIAVEAMHENACDIRETVFDAGFILKKKEGLYNCCGSDERTYFEWDPDREGYFETEEPEAYKHIAY